MRTLLAPLLATALALAPQVARAFCGFYVSGADAKLLNNATSVVLMRDGTRTVLSMQNNYQGPPQDFAMVVPVPVVLGKGDVRTIDPAVFDRVDALAGPRLVEYWEQDPCPSEPEFYPEPRPVMDSTKAESVVLRRRAARDYGVTIEAKFAVGEYQIVILGARDSSGLDAWLRASGYKIPAGAEPVLRPYVQGGSKFFVAKVDARKVRFDERGQVMLSPLRFHYDSDTFSLPVRLGLINSGGKQDLIVHVLARQIRYEAANYPNVAIPTNLDVADATRSAFGPFYAALFDRVLAAHPGAVVTEYAWSAGSCDPCPQDPLGLSELSTLGADVLPSTAAALGRARVASELQYSVPSDFVLTRLHARYGAEALGEDLVFQAAPAIQGGRETIGADGKIEQGAMVTHGVNNFQARYVIRHPWTGPIECENPRRGVWGGPPPGVAGDNRPQVARDLAFVPRDAQLSTFLAPGPAEPLEASVLAGGAVEVPRPDPFPRGSGCAGCDAGGGAGLAGLAGLALLAARRRRERRGDPC